MIFFKTPRSIYITGVILGILVGIFCTTMFYDLNYGAKFPERQDRVCGDDVLLLRSGGNSMQPYSYGGLAFVEPVEYGDIQLGDIIVYADPKNKSQAIRHAVIKITKLGLVTRGYNNPGKDNYLVQAEDVLYRSCLYVGDFMPEEKDEKNI
jgi:signal peptidase I